ncbi:ABC transporter, partial [Streptococcus thermophilus]|nr:ABC transporter [Streptococcus thermophilus]
SFVFTKISSITSLLAYGILFLVGFQEQSSHLIATLTRFLPFHLLVSFIRQPSWFVLLLLLGYGLIYWLLGYLCFQTCLTYAKKKGSLFHV